MIAKIASAFENTEADCDFLENTTWNQKRVQLYRKDSIKFNKIARDWTTFFTRGTGWHPSIHATLPETRFKKDVRLLLLILQRSDVVLPKEIIGKIVSLMFVPPDFPEVEGHCLSLDEVS